MEQLYSQEVSGFLCLSYICWVPSMIFKFFSFDNVFCHCVTITRIISLSQNPESKSTCLGCFVDSGGLGLPMQQPGVPLFSINSYLYTAQLMKCEMECHTFLNLSSWLCCSIFFTSLISVFIYAPSWQVYSKISYTLACEQSGNKEQ